MIPLKSRKAYYELLGNNVWWVPPPTWLRKQWSTQSLTHLHLLPFPPFVIIGPYSTVCTVSCSTSFRVAVPHLPMQSTLSQLCTYMYRFVYLRKGVIGNAGNFWQHGAANGAGVQHRSFLIGSVHELCLAWLCYSIYWHGCWLVILANLLALSEAPQRQAFWLPIIQTIFWGNCLIFSTSFNMASLFFFLFIYFIVFLPLDIKVSHAQCTANTKDNKSTTYIHLRSLLKAIESPAWEQDIDDTTNIGDCTPNGLVCRAISTSVYSKSCQLAEICHNTNFPTVRKMEINNYLSHFWHL